MQLSIEFHGSVGLAIVLDLVILVQAGSVINVGSHFHGKTILGCF